MTADDRCKALFGLPPATEPSFALFLERIFPEDRPVAEQHIAEATVRPVTTRPSIVRSGPMAACTGY